LRSAQVAVAAKSKRLGLSLLRPQRWSIFGEAKHQAAMRNWQGSKCMSLRCVFLCLVAWMIALRYCKRNFFFAGAA
jgi:hypothetical protein